MHTHSLTHTHTQCSYVNENLYAIGLGMQATNAEAPAGLGVPSDVDEGMCITIGRWFIIVGVSLSEQHTAGFTSSLLQSDLALSTYKLGSHLSIQLQGNYYGYTGMG